MAKKTIKNTKVEKKDAVKVVYPRLKKKYTSEIVAKLQKISGYKNINQVPEIKKIVVNIGVGDATQDTKLIELASKDLQTITGQKPTVRIAKKSISNFKLREGMPIGTKVTLRGKRMYEFLDRFIAVALPRVRDFRGISDKSFDGRGNYTLGLKEQNIFPEIDVDNISRVFGMDITFVTSANTDKEAYELLAAFGMPFRKKINH